MAGSSSGGQGLAATLGVLAGMLVLWEIAVRVFAPPPIILPPPSAIIVELAAAPRYFLRHAGFTLWTTLAGFVLAVVLGVALAVAIVASRWADRIITTLLVVLNSLPKVALAPLFVIWMGTGAEPKIAISPMSPAKYAAAVAERPMPRPLESVALVTPVGSVAVPSGRPFTYCVRRPAVKSATAPCTW